MFKQELGKNSVEEGQENTGDNAHNVVFLVRSERGKYCVKHGWNKGQEMRGEEGSAFNRSERGI